MTEFSQERRVSRMTGPVGDRPLLFRSLWGIERVSNPFEYRVMTMLQKEPDREPDGLLGAPACVEIRGESAEIRFFHGRVSHVAYAGTDRAGYLYELTLRPEFWFMSRNRECRIFQDMSVPQIIQKLLPDGGASRYRFDLQGSFPKRTYCVQYRESDFDFLSRLMEEEGIFYFFEHEKDAHTMVIGNTPSLFKPRPGYETVPYYPPTDRGQRERDHLDSWAQHHTFTANSVTLRDWNFEKPEIPSGYRRSDPRHIRDSFEIYDYPGGFTDNEQSLHYAELRRQAERAMRISAISSGDAMGLTAGAQFTLSNFDVPSENGAHVVIEARHRIEGDSYQSGQGLGQGPRVDLVTIPATAVFRPPLTTPRPRILGTQTAIVTGSAGEEIETDRFGRIKVQFHWDREGKKDENSSCWIRVAQSWAGASWGNLFIPRIGQEVLVEFLEGNPDRPIVTGAVYNGDHDPPYGLPGAKTKSTIKSNSSKGGGGFNEMRFEDRKGQEEYFMHAQKDMNVEVLNNLDTQVGNKETRSVGASRSTTIGSSQNETVGTSDSLTVGTNRSATIGANDSLTVGASRSATITASDSLTVGGTMSTTVGATATETVGATRSATVGGVESVTVGGTYSLTVGGAMSVNVGGPIMMNAGGPIVMNSGSLIAINSAGAVIVVGNANIVRLPWIPIPV